MQSWHCLVSISACQHSVFLNGEGVLLRNSARFRAVCFIGLVFRCHVVQHDPLHEPHKKRVIWHAEQCLVRSVSIVLDAYALSIFLFKVLFIVARMHKQHPSMRLQHLVHVVAHCLLTAKSRHMKHTSSTERCARHQRRLTQHLETPVHVFSRLHFTWIASNSELACR